MQDSSWPGENPGVLPVQEPAVRPRERKHPGSVSPLQDDAPLSPAELCCLSPVELLSQSRGLEARAGRSSKSALSCRVCTSVEPDNKEK